MKVGRFVIDTDVHPQGFLSAEVEREGDGGGTFSGPSAQPYDNTRRLRFDMETYGVDMCVLVPALGMSDELNLEIASRFPDCYVVACGLTDYARRCRTGGTTWAIDEVCTELDTMLGTGRFVAAAGSLPYLPPIASGRPAGRVEATGNLLQVAEVCRRRGTVLRLDDAPATAATSRPGSRPPADQPALRAFHELAASFPDLTILLGHGGPGAGSGWHEAALEVARAHENVYLETGLWWRERYAEPLADPRIGPERLLWGTDWGSSGSAAALAGPTPPSSPVRLDPSGKCQHQVDYWGWSLRELTSLRLCQDDLNLVVGGNALRLFRLSPPTTGLFRSP